MTCPDCKRPRGSIDVDPRIGPMPAGYCWRDAGCYGATVTLLDCRGYDLAIERTARQAAEKALMEGKSAWPQSLSALIDTLGTFPAGREFIRRLDAADIAEKEMAACDAAIDEAVGDEWDSRPEAIDKLRREMGAAIDAGIDATLRAEVAEADRDAWQQLAGRLATALRSVKHDRPSAHSDAVWAVLNDALAEYAAKAGT